MKIKELSLSNFAKYDAVNVSFADNVTYLVGKNGAGKSTIGITAIWFMFSGIAEKATNGTTPLIGERFRFIGPKAATAKGQMVLLDEKTGAEIKVIRKLTKTGSELSFEGPEGMELGQSWLNDLFNIFLIAPKRFLELSPKEQANAVGVDTTPFDKSLAALKTEHTNINRDLTPYKTLAPVEESARVDLAALQARRKEIRDNMAEKYKANQAANLATRKAWETAKAKVDVEVKEHNEMQQARLANIAKANKSLADLASVGYEGEEVSMWIAGLLSNIEEMKVATDLYPAEPINLTDLPEDHPPIVGGAFYIKEIPDETELQAIDKEIMEAGQTNEKALLFEQYLEKVKAKEVKEKELYDNKQAQADKIEERLNYIKAFKFPFSNLTVDDDGQLLLGGKPIRDPYFSTGELLKIVPILLSTTNPELKYVFIQGFKDLDEDNWKQVEEHLTSRGFQLVVELVGKEKLTDKNCILLKDNIVVEDYAVEDKPQLV